MEVLKTGLRDDAVRLEIAEDVTNTIPIARAGLDGTSHEDMWQPLVIAKHAIEHFIIDIGSHPFDLSVNLRESNNPDIGHVVRRTTPELCNRPHLHDRSMIAGDMYVVDHHGDIARKELPEPRDIFGNELGFATGSTCQVGSAHDRPDNVVGNMVIKKAGLR